MLLIRCGELGGEVIGKFRSRSWPTTFLKIGRPRQETRSPSLRREASSHHHRPATDLYDPNRPHPPRDTLRKPPSLPQISSTHHHVTRRPWPRSLARPLPLGRTLRFRRRILYGSTYRHSERRNVLVTDFGAPQAIGGAVWHGIKGFRNSPYNERMIGCTTFPPS